MIDLRTLFPNMSFVRVGPTEQQRAKAAQKLHDRMHSLEADDDLPAHLRNEPTWTQLLGNK